MESYFINEAFDCAINDYLNSRDAETGVLYNSFLVVVIRMLINIYGELDIINPYHMRDETAFLNNLKKFGVSEEEINNLARSMDGFYVIDRRNEGAYKRENNPYFISVQKIIIDLYNQKRLTFGVAESDAKVFYDLLYTPRTSSALRLSYNYLNAENIFEIDNYYHLAMQKKLEIPKEEKKLLKKEIYDIFNISEASLDNMSSADVDRLNSQIFKSLDISENAINRDYLLDEKIKEILNVNEPITTGNGYVDILIIMSIIITVLMVVVIFSTLVF